MSQSTPYGNVSFDDTALRGVIGYYFEEVERQHADVAAQLRARAASDEVFVENLKRATSDALLLSTLAAVLKDDSAFLEAVEQSLEFEDPFFAAMRLDLFDYSLEQAVTVAKPSRKDLQSIEARATQFRSLRGVPPAAANPV